MTPKPYNLKNPPHLIANEVLRSVDNEGIHAAIERLIIQYQELLFQQNVPDHLGTLTPDDNKPYDNYHDLY